MRKKILRYRQGDVMFHRISVLPQGSRKIRKNGVIAFGEATGHTHALAVLEDAEVLGIGDGVFVRVTAEGGVSVQHQEHQQIRLPKGNYRVTIQREYSPEEIRNVAD